MKQLCFCILLLAFAVPSFSQRPEISPSFTKADYLTRSKHQKTAAWVLTGAGMVGLGLTLNADMGQAVGGGLTSLFSLGTIEPEYKSYTVPYLLSAAVLGTGIAFFIASSKSKRKAREVGISSFLKMETAPVVQKMGFPSGAYPSVALKVCF